MFTLRIRHLFLSVVSLCALAVLINYQVTAPASADVLSSSVIVQFTQDPAAIYKAKTEKAGGTVSSEQLQTYRNQLRTSQDQFLTDLRARGVAFAIDGVDVPNFTGEIAGHVEFRYTLVMNGIALRVSP